MKSTQQTITTKEVYERLIALETKVDLASEVDKGSVGGIGFMFRYQDAGNYYYVAINTFVQAVYVNKVIGGGGIYDNGVGSFTGGYTNSNVYTVRVDLSGSSIKVYVDNVLRIDATDSEFSAAGTVGLWSDSGDGFIDDFIVTGTESGGTVVIRKNLSLLGVS